MNGNLRKILGLNAAFLSAAAVLFLAQYVLKQLGILHLNQKIHILLFLLSMIVVLSLSVAFFMGKKDIIGYMFLGFVVFKMFGVGYIAKFLPGFRENLIPFFIVFWIYLALEAFIAVKFIQNKT